LAFTPSAVDAGARAVFGFPILVEDIRLGTLNLYRDRPGPLNRDQHEDAVILAALAGRAIVNMQAGAHPGDLSPALETGANFRFVVHQAAGMVSGLGRRPDEPGADRPLRG
jgi:GAF domain-containing protein